jgi:hypothetical protein
MQAASLLDGFSFDLFPPFENGPAAAKDADGAAKLGDPQFKLTDLAVTLLL